MTPGNVKNLEKDRNYIGAMDNYLHVIATTDGREEGGMFTCDLVELDRNAMNLIHKIIRISGLLIRS